MATTPASTAKEIPFFNVQLEQSNAVDSVVYVYTFANCILNFFFFSNLAKSVFGQDKVITAKPLSGGATNIRTSIMCNLLTSKNFVNTQCTC